MQVGVEQLSNCLNFNFARNAVCHGCLLLILFLKECSLPKLPVIIVKGKKFDMHVDDDDDDDVRSASVQRTMFNMLKGGLLWRTKVR